MEKIEVYVDKLPINCDTCPCCNKDYEQGHSCNLGLELDMYETIGEKALKDRVIPIKRYEVRPENCPLKLIGGKK